MGESPASFEEQIFLATPTQQRRWLSQARAATRRDVAGHHDVRALHLLANAVDTLGFLIAATTSIVNRLAVQTSDGVSHETLTTYLPPEFPQSQEFVLGLVWPAMPPDALADVQEFHARLATARVMTLAYTRYPAEVRQKGGVDIDVLSGVWRDLCEHTHNLLTGLHYAADCLGRRPAPISRSASLLAASANGETPCLLDDGTVEIKGWVERRRHDRWSVGWAATLLNGTTTEQAQIVNLSLGGFCLATASALYCCDQVVVELATNRRLSGGVTWSRGARYGIRFNAPLQATDPIIRAAQSGRVP